MSIIVDKYALEEETFLKALILIRGIIFSENALKIANFEKAKGQNLVYNMPLNAINSRPQELIIKNAKLKNKKTQNKFIIVHSKE